MRTIFEQPDSEQVFAQHARVVEQLPVKFADAATVLIDAGPRAWAAWQSALLETSPRPALGLFLLPENWCRGAALKRA